MLNPQLYRQASQRGLDQESRLRVPADLAVEVQQRVQNRRQTSGCRVVLRGNRRQQPVAGTFHQSPHDLAQLGARGVDAVQLLQRLRRAAREHVGQQPVEKPRIGDSEE